MSAPTASTAAAESVAPDAETKRSAETVAVPVAEVAAADASAETHFKTIFT